MTGVPQPNMIPKVVESQAIPQPVTIAPKGNASFAIPQPVMPAEQAVPLQQQRPIQSKVADFGDTTILSSATANETTILSDDQLFAKKQAKLVRVNNRETILINKRVFKIGKAQDYADYYIADNVAVSRSHAMIIQLDGEYYIEDTNSTNHTYVDGQLIQSNVRVKLADGQKISLANEEFEFHIG